MLTIHYIVLAVLVIAAFCTDIRTMRIPNALTVCGALAGLLVHAGVSRWDGLVFSLTGMLAGFGTLLVLYAFGAIGAGDVKLFGAIGALAGTEFVLYSIMYSIVYAGAIGVVILLFRRETVMRIGRIVRCIAGFVLFRDMASAQAIRHEKNIRFPFMVAALPGIVTAYFYLI